MIGELRTLGIKANAEGRPADAIHHWTQMMEAQATLNKDRSGIRYLSGEFWTNGIGHIGLLDFFIKRKLLGLDDSHYIICTVPKLIANECYFNLWRSHFDVINWRPVDAELREDWPMVLRLGDEWLPLEIATHRVNAMWKRGPIISLPRHTKDRGWYAVKCPWFVAIHARQGSAYGEDSVRDIADLSTYDKAIDLIQDAGGRVFFIGQPNPAWLDTFLISQCRFFVGCNSGPAVAAATFGTPSLLVNFAPRNGLFPYDVKILRKHLINAKGEEADPDDPIGNEWSKKRLGKWRLIDNSADEIARAVEEMLKSTEIKDGIDHLPNHRRRPAYAHQSLHCG